MSWITPERHPIIWMIGTCFLGFLFALNTYPSILYIVRQKRLMDEPESRSVHEMPTPTLGGVGIFISVVVAFVLIGAFLDTKMLLLITGSLTILFFIGLKDDLAGTSPYNKLLSQLLAAALLLVFTNTRIIGFSGIFDIYELPYWASFVFTLFVYVVIVNAFNLIDGIDGLAASIAAAVSLILAILFYLANQLSLAIIAMALVGALLAFLRYNFSSEHKIFMGDTGSMVVGFLLAFFTISFIHLAQTNALKEFHRSAPALAFAFLFYPLIDTLRVFILRVFKYKVSPFRADRNHIHHHILNLGFTHLQTTLWITSINCLISLIAFQLQDYNLNIQIVSLLCYGSLLYALPFIFKLYVESRMPERKH